ncbi:MAG: hypothetical protein ACP5IV_04220 [Caldisericia bacterium]
MKFSEIKDKIKNNRDFNSVKEIKEKGLRIVRNTKTGDYWLIEEEYLKPVIKSPRECKSILIKPEDLKYKVIMVHKSKQELKGKKVLDYIEWGERQKFNERPTCKSRKFWWNLGEWEISKNILPMFEAERKYCFYNEINVYIDAALYWCYIKNEKNEKYYNLLLNSTIMGFCKEILCRPPEGLGALQMKVYHYSEMYIPQINLIKFDLKLFDNFVKREILPIIIELGFDPDKPIREQEPNPLPDRKVLDDIVFDALGLTEEERKEVYWAVAELVQNRLKKAKSV